MHIVVMQMLLSKSILENVQKCLNINRPIVRPVIDRLNFINTIL